jgi:hypothetical protein
MRHAAALLLVLSCAVATADAQEVPPARAPQTVRVHLRNEDTVQGYLRGHSKDEVVIFTGEGRYRHVPMADVQRVEVRSRNGSHIRRGAVIGLAVWAGVVAAASRGSLDKWGVTSWESAAVLAGSVGLGAVIGSRVPRYGWRPTEVSALAALPPPPGFRVTLRF